MFFNGAKYVVFEHNNTNGFITRPDLTRGRVLIQHCQVGHGLKKVLGQVQVPKIEPAQNSTLSIIDKDRTDLLISMINGLQTVNLLIGVTSHFIRLTNRPVLALILNMISSKSQHNFDIQYEL